MSAASTVRVKSTINKPAASSLISIARPAAESGNGTILIPFDPCSCSERLHGPGWGQPWLLRASENQRPPYFRPISQMPDPPHTYSQTEVSILQLSEELVCGIPRS